MFIKGWKNKSQLSSLIQTFWRDTIVLYDKHLMYAFFHLYDFRVNDDSFNFRVN